MAIRGSLQDATLPDVIQMLHQGRRSGRLSVTDRQHRADVHFEQGMVAHAAIMNRRDRLGDLLLKRGAITPAQLEQALDMQAIGTGLPLGQLLVDLGAISPAGLAGVLLEQVQEAVYALFHWTSGTFQFESGIPLPAEVSTPLALAPDALLLEGARRVDEWALIERKIPRFDLVFVPDRAQVAVRALDLTAVQRRLLPLLTPTRDVRGLIEESGLSEFEVCQALYGLVTAGLVQRVGTAVSAAAARSLDGRVAEHRELGQGFLQAGLLEEAGREFRRIAELRPSEGAAPFFLGMIAARQGHWPEAVAQFRAAVERGGPRPAVLHNLAVALDLAGERDQAERCFVEAESRAPADAGLQLSWGIAALRRELPALALVRLGRAQAILGDRLPASWHWAVARAHAMLGEMEQALATAATGTARFPSHPVLRNEHAVYLEAAGDPEAAERELLVALAEAPDLPQVSKNLGDVRYRLGRYAEAWEDYQRALRLRSDGGEDLHFKLGSLALRRGDRPAAEGYWRQVLVLNPHHHLARANLESLARE